MPVLITDKHSIAPLFSGWEQTMIYSCLQDCMGVAYADSLQFPASAQIIIGGFSFLAGDVNHALLKNNPSCSFEVLAPQNRQWEKAIEETYGNRAIKQTRYATKKNPDVFDLKKLHKYAALLAPEYSFKLIDKVLYQQVMASDWAIDLCANFKDFTDFAANGLGVVVLKNGEIVSGAASYTYYKTGIEIEIDTKKEERRKGLALACGAKLILECLERNLYPSWDAYSRISLSLAEKLGYQFDKEYTVYALV